MVQRRAWDPRLSTGSTYLSLVHPSLLHPSFGGLAVRELVPKKLSRVQGLACLGITGAISTTPTSAMEALTCLPPLEILVSSEARLAVHCLWRLGYWSYLHRTWGQSSILMRLQQSDPIFNTGVEVMRSAFNFEPKYKVNMLTREEQTAWWVKKQRHAAECGFQ
jgi:hypothetical protein